VQIFNFKQALNFMRFKTPALVLSGLLVLGSFVTVAVKGINWGLDFTGGTVIEAGFSQSVDLTQVRQVMDESGYGDAIVQYFGSSQDISIRLAPREGVEQSSISSEVLSALAKTTEGNVELRRVEFVGPAVGEELREQGGLAMLTALMGILLYVGMRFEWKLSAGAVLALAHDVILTIGLFSLLQLEFDLTVLAAILALIGYSINDTIVVFDRIRESFRKLRDMSVVETVNDAVTMTLNRTVVTSVSTMMVLVILFYMGGALIHNFALALLFGIGVGTYSSIFVASSIAVQFGLTREDMLPAPPPEKEGEGTPPVM
jgi:preprotein translocase subunit SecF